MFCKFSGNFHVCTTSLWYDGPWTDGHSSFCHKKRILSFSIYTDTPYRLHESEAVCVVNVSSCLEFNTVLRVVSKAYQHDMV